MNDPYIYKTQHILSGKIEHFSHSEILKLLMHMNDKDTPINTLMIQKSYDGSYCVKVDECTVDAYKNYLENRGQIMTNIEAIEQLKFDILEEDSEDLTANEAISLMSEMYSDYSYCSKCLFYTRTHVHNITCNEWKKTYPDEVIKILKQFKKEQHSYIDQWNMRHVLKIEEI